jgi:S-DNA-T family DNA segregation ATPase FtsK/SpoIIIE
LSRLRKNAAKRKRKGGQKPSWLVSALRWTTLLFVLVFLTWSLVLPQSGGALGQSLHDALLGIFGLAAYLLPPVLFFGFASFFRSGNAKGLWTFAIGSVLSLLGTVLVLGVLAVSFNKPEWGGAAGSALAAWGVSALGRFGVTFIGLAMLALGQQVLFDISWSKVIQAGLHAVLDDYRSWSESRSELKDIVSDAAAKLPNGTPAKASKKTPEKIAPIPEAAKKGAAPPEPIAPEPEPAQAEEAGRDLPIIEKKKKAAPKASTPSPKTLPVAGENGAEYQLPPLDLLQKPTGAITGRPSDGEIREAADNLASTLKSFDIEAKISGISPGPVITRYEVTPAPGVTVSSIVARANDIALAMRARGIRMIAPIPGKAAIGIEVPNEKGATVTMREVMESDAMAKEKSVLGFALGLSSDGDPLSGDLMKMPHALVAGATNSGKSVLVHSMIASILFRQKPDEVKLLLIDPKRIELTLYDGIPHLYDPKTPPEEVQVITQPKAASRALKALLRVMEDRYEKYQVYKVQNIQQYNREAIKRGEKPDFYIVVVIDELADLMVVARDVVEDSIQRLTQMARAVGIHLVIATQRPSVDVITGVIKANLPSRIAMRVASKIDSKVVLDSVGAEALQGRGDALYLIPGLDPQRIQGAFVSTEEINGLVDYLKSQAKPDYPLLDTMMSGVGEADLSQFGVEPLEFTQAMKLVMERRRVSQDLLKSQFGSSARATNLLSLLEVKGFINKPEGSNRWQIHFDKIEDYLQKNAPQALKKKGI